MKLVKVTLNKYKSFLHEQSVDIEKKVTRLVGKNESGKTAFLEALSKFNYFDNNNTDFVFDKTHDYPRNELKKYELNYPLNDQNVVICEFEIGKDLLEDIENDVGPNIFVQNSFSVSKRYNGEMIYVDLTGDTNKFIKKFLSENMIDTKDVKDLEKSTTLNELYEKISANPQWSSIATSLKNSYIDKCKNKLGNGINEYIASVYLEKRIPKFWYFDEYYSIPYQISLTKYKNKTIDISFTKEQYEIVKALFDLAGVNVEKILSSNDHEAFIAELEATSNSLTDQFLEYWTTNSNLEILFDIQQIANDKILNIRIKNTKHRVTLPLKNRSKGFTWFFSFLVWFSKIEKDENIIILLDEPGLNLHAEAQSDLLKYIDEQLSTKYQTIYTTHSPFMIDPTKLCEVRTVYDSGESKIGSVISDALEEKDKSTLFPLQAALGYDIAQNLYISKNNLLVEGVADLVYLTILSERLKLTGRTGLNDSITVIPVGGLDKVVTFISLLRGNNLKIACLLDTFIDQKGRRRMTDLIQDKIIKENNVRFYDEFTTMSTSDIEDIFNKEDYINLFNLTFAGTPEISCASLDDSLPVISQLNKLIESKRFNHYSCANYLSKNPNLVNSLSVETLERFEKIFIAINKLF